MRSADSRCDGKKGASAWSLAARLEQFTVGVLIVLGPIPGWCSLPFASDIRIA